jgi:1-acyl-sn-glycerol-3-phosphate acyltransferase
VTFTLVRSFAFDALFYAWGTLVTTLAIPLFVLPRKVTLYGFRFWAWGSMTLMRHVLGLHDTVRGTWPEGPFIVAAKHQSMWETIALITYVRFPSFILKRSLFYIPLVGGYLKKMGMLWVDRAATKNLSSLLSQAKEAVAQGRTVVIFPEGRRTALGEAPLLKSGVWYVAQHLNLPVVPMRHNAGRFWPRRSWIKTAGTLDVHIVKPIDPAQHTRQSFMEALHTALNEQGA